MPEKVVGEDPPRTTPADEEDWARTAFDAFVESRNEEKEDLSEVEVQMEQLKSFLLEQFGPDCLDSCLVVDFAAAKIDEYDDEIYLLKRGLFKAGLSLARKSTEESTVLQGISLMLQVGDFDVAAGGSGTSCTIELTLQD